jgi:hypothetical protein
VGYVITSLWPFRQASAELSSGGMALVSLAGLWCCRSLLSAPPDEAALILPIIHVISNRRATPHTDEDRVFVRNLVRRYVSNVGLLFALAKDISQRPHIRGAAAMMCLHPKCSLKRQFHCIELIVKNYESNNSGWYLRAAMYTLESFVAEQNETALDAMGRILRAASGDFMERRSVNAVFDRWRETSTAPVNRGILETF